LQIGLINNILILSLKKEEKMSTDKYSEIGQEIY